MRPTHVSAASKIYPLPSNGDGAVDVTYPPVHGDPYIIVKRYNRRSYSPKCMSTFEFEPVHGTA
jgi:hypothetical protein